MDLALDDQRRYLAALVAAAAPEPGLHRCQLAALAREQALAAAAPDSATYRRTSGDLFETARAAWLDRLVAHARVAIERDDPWTATAALVELEAALAACDHGDWTACLTAGSTAGQPWHARAASAKAAFAGVITQILLLDIVFSLDSVITAVGMTDKLGVMVAAVIGAVAVMLFFAGSISEFVRRHPTVKMLALAFLLVIGVVLIADGMGNHVPKGYVYFAMAFSVAVEMLNIHARKKRKAKPVELHSPYREADAADRRT